MAWLIDRAVTSSALVNIWHCSLGFQHAIRPVTFDDPAAVTEYVGSAYGGIKSLLRDAHPKSD
jgi:hypothetical protein